MQPVLVQPDSAILRVELGSIRKVRNHKKMPLRDHNLDGLKLLRAAPAPIKLVLNQLLPAEEVEIVTVRAKWSPVDSLGAM